eukprot:TRINITY_DN31883_c0_g1_i1.p1 TRINITY_DN31883_c0_g1~~TRINITY_DN31883_c0_g1_i1.p1  ORF type:complete len:704 (-),score=102.45 TRINITY_DN31883_c0_g1_i1:344-2455(-)
MDANSSTAALLQRISELEVLIEQQAKTSNSFQLDVITSLDAMWTLSSMTLVFMMQLGFAMLEAGCVREQSVVSTYAKNIMDFVLSVIVDVAGAFHFAYPQYSTHILADVCGLETHDLRKALFVFINFQCSAVTIISGAIAERTKIGGYLIFSTFAAAFLFPFAVRFTWGGGFLSQLDPPVHDFAGSGVVHLLGGVTALVGCRVVGPREGRWDPARAVEFVPHNVPSVFTGTMLLWFGWFGFNAGSVSTFRSVDDASIVSNAFVVTAVSACFAAGSLIALNLVGSRCGSFDALQLCNAILSGLVGITAGCDCISTGCAAIVGIISTWVYMCGDYLVKATRTDDVVGAFSVHGMCGAWGLLAVGLFHHSDGLFMGGSGRLLLSQFYGVLVLGGFPVLPAALFFLVLRRLGPLRVGQQQEARGLDDALGMTAYASSKKSMAETSYLAAFLKIYRIRPKTILEAHYLLRDQPKMSYTPEASDYKQRCEIEDILAALDYDSGNARHFIFVCRHQEDGAQVARTFSDNMCRQLISSRRPERRLVSSQLSADRIIYHDMELSKDLQEVLDHVAASNNFVILLTKQVLCKPWVLAALTTAMMHSKNIICVNVDWGKKDAKKYSKERDLEVRIECWEEHMRLEGQLQDSSSHGSSPTASRNGQSFAFQLGEAETFRKNAGEKEAVNADRRLVMTDGDHWRAPDDEAVHHATC